MKIFYTILQYVATLTVVLIATIYLINLIKSSFKSKDKKQDCNGSNCNCK